jgi:hypothetical protein
VAEFVRQEFRLWGFTMRIAEAIVCVVMLTCLGARPWSAETRAKIADCRIESGGMTEFAGKCRFMLDGDAGSFSLDRTDHQGPLYGRTLTVSVSVISPGIAEVFGLTDAGNNSHWGKAERSTRERACWIGSDFKICAR